MSVSRLCRQPALQVGFSLLRHIAKSMKYILAVLVMTFSMQSTADNWLCIADKATGFALENGIGSLLTFGPGTST